MFVRCCLVLHNLILRLEGGQFDAEYREHLCEAGRDIAPLRPDIDDGDDASEDQELRRARRRVDTPGKRFRRELMTRLFDSLSSGATRRQ
jgi:hypothetical protein